MPTTNLLYKSRHQPSNERRRKLWSPGVQEMRCGANDIRKATVSLRVMPTQGEREGKQMGVLFTPFSKPCIHFNSLLMYVCDAYYQLTPSRLIRQQSYMRFLGLTEREMGFSQQFKRLFLRILELMRRTMLRNLICNRH